MKVVFYVILENHTTFIYFFLSIFSYAHSCLFHSFEHIGWCVVFCCCHVIEISIKLLRCIYHFMKSKIWFKSRYWCFTKFYLIEDYNFVKTYVYIKSNYRDGTTICKILSFVQNFLLLWKVSCNWKRLSKKPLAILDFKVYSTVLQIVSCFKFNNSLLLNEEFVTKMRNYIY